MMKARFGIASVLSILLMTSSLAWAAAIQLGPGEEITVHPGEETTVRCVGSGGSGHGGGGGFGRDAKSTVDLACVDQLASASGVSPSVPKVLEWARVCRVVDPTQPGCMIVGGAMNNTCASKLYRYAPTNSPTELSEMQKACQDVELYCR